MPIIIPRIPAAIITRKASYMNTRLPSSFVIPMERNTPYSHTFSLMFEVVATSKRKNVSVKAINPIRPTRRLKPRFALIKDLRIYSTSTIRVDSLIKGLMPFMIYCLR